MEVAGLYQFVLALVLIGLVVGVGLVVLGQFKSSLTASSAEANATQSAITALATIPSTWLGLIVTIVVVAIILTIVIRSFSGGQR
jgi:type II secretory pathway component PulF